jgi:hypothetical protein
MELLKQLYRISSPSGKEKKMRKFIKDWVNRNVADAVVEWDKLGNLYVTRGESPTYPCVVAHMDQVQDPHEKDFQVFNLNGKLYGFSGCKMEMRGLGADDKNGIWVALNCLAKYKVFKCAFFVGEEVGCVGSEGADMTFFDDCRWVVQCDRKGGSDLITNASWTELCSKEFVNAIQPERFGYKVTKGLMTDVMALKENGLNVSCVNMSCGYYRPHTEEEYTVFGELQNCLDFVQWIVENVMDVYPHEYEYKAYGKYAFGAGSQYDYYGFGKAWDINGGEPKPVDTYIKERDDKRDDNGKTRAERRDEQFDQLYEDVDAYLMSWPEADITDVANDLSYRFPDLSYDEIMDTVSEVIGWYR